MTTGRGRTPAAQTPVPERFRALVAETADLAEAFVRSGFRLYLVGGSVRDALSPSTAAADLGASDLTAVANRRLPPSITHESGGGTSAGVEAGATYGSDGASPTDGNCASGHASRTDEDQGGFEPSGHDLDFTTDARPEDTEKILTHLAGNVYTQGKRFGTIGCVVSGRHYEITTHRAEAYSPDSRKPTVKFSTDIEADLSRRDFTVNAMALRLPDLELIDPFGGISDLASATLRTPLSPEQSFDDDPLRMLRAARFIAGRHMTPQENVVTAVRKMHGRLAIVSPERIRNELDRLIVVDDPSDGLWFIVDTGLAAEFFPELPGLAVEQDPIHHHKDVLAHTIAVVAKTRPDRILRLAALFHDIGKPSTRSIGPEGVSFHHHEVVGARMTVKRMKELRYSAGDIDEVSRLVELHLRFHTYQMGWTDSAVRRYVRDAGELLDRLNELTRCDCTTRNRNKAEALGRRMDELEARITELAEQEALHAIRPDLDGVQIMEHLGIEPGPLVGEALGHLLEIRLEEGPIGEDEAYLRLDAWWSGRDT